MNPQVSIILPFRNAEETLCECLDSILEQTNANWEVLAVNDHSLDNSAEIIRTYGREDSRITHMHSPGMGIADAINYGIDSASSGILARMDSDDLMRPTRIQDQSEFLQRNPQVDLVSTKISHFTDIPGAESTGYGLYVDWTNTLLSHKEISDNQFIDSPFAHPSVMFRKSSILRYGRYKTGDFPEDYELWLRWLNQGARMEKINKTLLEWRDRPNRLSRIAKEYSKQSFQSIKAKYFALWASMSIDQSLRLTAWGAGKVARRQASFLSKQSISFDCFYEVDEKKIGRSVGNSPIKSIHNLSGPSEEFIVGLAGARGARAKISDFLDSRGYALGKNYILLA